MTRPLGRFTEEIYALMRIVAGFMRCTVHSALCTDLLRSSADLVEMIEEVGGILEHAIGTRAFEFFQPVPA
jgi:hypothetical protein